MTNPVDIIPSRDALVGHTRVRRALPTRGRRTVGAWCFVDHMGPATVDRPDEVGIGPHPHMGLHTVTWLLAGELRHLDTVGSDQAIRPGQLNLMTAGNGVAHAEEPTTYRGEFHGVQLWVAQPESTRHGAPAFEHHAELPRLELDRATASVLVGELDGATSSARRDTEMMGADLALRPGVTTVPIRPDFEYALVVMDGVALVDGQAVKPGNLAYLGLGRDELGLRTDESTRALLIGGVPFESEVLMWWNFVARTRDEVREAQGAWNDASERFGAIMSKLDRIPAPDLPWT